MDSLGVHFQQAVERIQLTPALLDELDETESLSPLLLLHQPHQLLVGQFSRLGGGVVCDGVVHVSRLLGIVGDGVLLGVVGDVAETGAQIDEQHVLRERRDAALRTEDAEGALLQRPSLSVVSRVPWLPVCQKQLGSVANSDARLPLRGLLLAQPRSHHRRIPHRDALLLLDGGKCHQRSRIVLVVCYRERTDESLEVMVARGCFAARQRESLLFWKLDVELIGVLLFFVLKRTECFQRNGVRRGEKGRTVQRFQRSISQRVRQIYSFLCFLTKALDSLASTCISAAALVRRRTSFWRDWHICIKT